MIFYSSLQKMSVFQTDVQYNSPSPWVPPALMGNAEFFHLTKCLRVLRDAAAPIAAFTAVARSARGRPGLWLEQRSFEEAREQAQYIINLTGDTCQVF